MKKPVEPFVRVNTRITPKQMAFIKSEAKKLGKTEGEIYRNIIQTFIINK